MADCGRRGAPYLAAVELTAELEPEPDRVAPELLPMWPPWVRPISDYERKETTVVEGLRYG